MPQKRRSVKKPGIDPFLLLLKAHSLPLPETEVVFAPPRKWRADYLWRYEALPGWSVGRCYLGLIVERNGGIWRKGGHSSGKGLLRDYSKSNAAQLLGFLYLQFTPAQLDSGDALDTLTQVLG